VIEFAEGNKPSHGGREGPSFGEIVGQAELKQALLAVAANDELDGLLLSGEKGTAKSTAVRALRDLLPTQSAVADCPFGCPPGRPAEQCGKCRDREEPPTTERPVPLVTLPLGATRDRVVGSLSVADALDGAHEFEPGLLARANRGILYVDEVNLLDDHLVDVLLDAAASGVNRVERDGVSVVHPAEFTLIGTMNPEEGDLRPQLRDRFALQATVTGCTDLDDRVAIVERALGDDLHGDAQSSDEPDTAAYRERLLTGRERLDEVDLPPAFARAIVELCRDAGVDGHRADIATARAARTFAALDDRPTVLERDVRRAASLALPHRLQARPFEDAADPDDVLDEHFESDERDDETHGDGDPDGSDETDSGGDDGADSSKDGDDVREGSEGSPPEAGDADDSTNAPPSTAEADRTSADGSPDAGGRTRDSGDAADGDDDGGSSGDESTDGAPLIPSASRAAAGNARAPDLESPEAVDATTAGAGTRAEVSPSADGAGPRVRSEPAETTRGVDVGESMRAAARRGSSAIESRDLRQSVRADSASTLVVFAVDASASMRAAMRAAKGTVLELLEDAYQQRDEVAFVTFAGEDAEVLLPPTDSVSLAARHLKDLPTGDRTPLPAGLGAARDVIERADPAASVVVVVTDGRANVADGSPVEATREAARAVGATGAEVVVVDAGEDDRSSLAGVVAEATGGQRVPLSALSADRVDAAARAANETQL